MAILLQSNLPSSRLTSRLENRLRQEIQMYLNHTLIPALRSRKNVNPSPFNNIITQYSNACYRLGASYTSKIANRELLNSEQDSSTKTNLVNHFTETFWNKIRGLASIQRLELRLKPSQLISMEKDRLSSEMSALVVWKSFNSGITSKGQELKDDLSRVKRNGLVGTTRTIWNKDFTGIYKQRLITDRIKPKPNPERTSQFTTEEEAAMSFVLVTVQDERVCDICRGLEFESWALADPDMPKLPDDTHPNCRCVLLLAETQEETEFRINKKELLDLGLTGTEIAMLGADITGLITGEDLRDHFEEVMAERKRLAKKKLEMEKKKLAAAERKKKKTR